MKNTMGCIALAFAFLAMIAIPALASGNNSAGFVIGMNQYFVNNQAPGISIDAVAYIDSNSGRTLIPVRYLGNALGIQDSGINWDANTQTVTLTSGSMIIILVINSTTMTVNGQAQTMGQAPVIKGGRTYLPARWVAEALGYQVDWNTTNKIMTIWLSGTSEPDYSNVIGQAQQANQPTQTTSLPKISAPSMCFFSVNSVDGITLIWLATNQTGKRIKYYHADLYMYNPVGDPSYDEITGKSMITVNYVGPVEIGGKMCINQIIAYSSACDKVVIKDIKIDYFDGTTETVSVGNTAIEGGF